LVLDPHDKVVLAFQTDQQTSSLYSLFSLVRAGEVIFGTRDVQPFEGWVSPTYGEKNPALSLAFEVKSDQNNTIVQRSSFFLMRIRAGVILIEEGKVALIERYRAGKHYYVFSRRRYG